jgi:hypothetical protein
MRAFVCLFVMATMTVCCAGMPDRGQIDHLLAADRCEKAVEFMESRRQGYGANGELLFLLDSAMVHLQCGRFNTAQTFFGEAERTADRLWTESISKNAASLLVNDFMRAYPGEDFERAMIHLMSAIGYIQVGALDDARVETRRLDTLLNVYNDKYVEKNVYKEDAFGRYLSGMLNEDDNAPDEAFIDYLLAARAYEDYQRNYGTPRPDALTEDLERLGRAVGRQEDVAELLGVDGDSSESRPANLEEAGKIVYIQFSGDAPEKIQDTLFIPTRRGPIALAFPRMVVRPPACSGGRLTLRSGEVSANLETELVEDVNRIAVKNLQDRKSRVVARTLVRAAVKRIAIEGVAGQGESQSRDAIRAILNVANLFMERADTRSWQTLPGEIHMARGYLPPGQYSAELRRCGGEPVPMAPVQLIAGQTRYVFYDTRYGVTGRK